ncbi:MAG: dephospho-CoA kinase [Deltaproteobacteria bacterium]
MKIIGLTGNIASGKSSVAGMFESLGARVIDADQVAREVVEPNAPAWREIVEEFGEEILYPSGTLNRAALGRVIFCDGDKREKLNRITHPRIMRSVRRTLSVWADEGVQIAVLEAALIVERGGLRDLIDALVVVTAPQGEQIRRLAKRATLSQQEALARVESQMPQSEKVKKADFVIDNSGGLDATRKQVEAVWKKIAEA